MKIRGVMGMVDTRSRGGLVLGSDCTDVRGYRRVPLWAYGGRIRGTVDCFWPDLQTLMFRATMPDSSLLRTLIVDRHVGPAMVLTGEGRSDRPGERYLPDWELTRLELVVMEPETYPWPQCSVAIERQRRRAPYVRL